MKRRGLRSCRMTEYRGSRASKTDTRMPEAVIRMYLKRGAMSQVSLACH